MLKPGAQVWCDEEEMTLVELKSLQQAVLQRCNGEHVTRPIAAIRIRKQPLHQRKGDIAAIDPDKWKEASNIANQMDALMAIPDAERTVKDIERVAKFFGKNRSTIYRWMDKHRANGSVSALLRKSRSDVGSRRLDAQIEQIIAEQIEKGYLGPNRRTVASVFNDIKDACLALDLGLPDLSTVRSRVNALDPKLVVERRYGRKYAQERYGPIRGSFPNANYPLAVVQIDHTPMDVIVVDEVWRKPIQRPYLTIAIDVYSKMIVGFYISLDPPGALATGQCISMSILGKEDFLTRLNLSDLPWPCWGKMRTVHTDNAKEFRGTMLGWAAKEHGINPERRPKGRPHYGGHVERGFRTFMAKVHEELPGTTFSNVQDRVDYNSEGHACMTLEAVEKWFTLYLLGHYHQQPHSGNDGFPPVYVWEKALLEGTEETPPTGVPLRVDNPEQLRMDFLPYFERTVQEYGIQNWGLTWYSDAIRRFVHARKNGLQSPKKTFICRYDPRDLSRISLYDEITKNYIDVPFRDLTRPPISLWEVKKAKQLNRAEAKSTTNETLIFQTITRMRKLVEEESETTKSARRQQQRQKQWERTRKAHPAKPATQPPQQKNSPLEDDIHIQPFEGIRES